MTSKQAAVILIYYIGARKRVIISKFTLNTCPRIYMKTGSRTFNKLSVAVKNCIR